MSSQHILTLLQSGLCWLNPAKIPELIGQIIFRKYISALLCPHRAKSKDSIHDLHGEVLFSFELLKIRQLHFSLFSFVFSVREEFYSHQCVIPDMCASSEQALFLKWYTCHCKLSRRCFIKSVVYTENTKGIKALRVHVKQTF